MGKYIKSKEKLKKHFSKEYYNSINYSNYSERKLKYDQTASDISNFFKIGKSESILDYGCATGMLLNGFKKLNYNKLQGYDISEWAISNPVNPSLKTTNNYLVVNAKYNYTIILDVLEHMFDSGVSNILNDIDTQHLIVRIPVKLLGGDDFYLEVSRKDKSHVNCKTKGEWIDFIESHGYQFNQILNLPSVYDSLGCFCGHFKKIK